MPLRCVCACLTTQTVAERAALEQEEEQVVVKDKQRKEQRKVRDMGRRGIRGDVGCVVAMRSRAHGVLSACHECCVRTHAPRMPCRKSR